MKLIVKREAEPKMTLKQMQECSGIKSETSLKYLLVLRVQMDFYVRLSLLNSMKLYLHSSVHN